MVRRLPGNVFLAREESGLPRDSVVNLTQLLTVDRGQLDEYVRDVPPDLLLAVEEGLRVVLDLA